MAENLPPELARLIEIERRTDLDPPPDVRDRIRSAWMAKVGGGGESGESGGPPTPDSAPGPTPPQPTPGTGWSSLALAGSSLLSLAIGVGLGLAAYPSLHPDRPAPVEHTAAPESPREPSADPVPEARAPSAAHDPPRIDAGERARPRAAHRATPMQPSAEQQPTPTEQALAAERPALDQVPPPTTLAAERALIDRARSALVAGRPHDALVALMRHEREFVDGEMRAERERLIVATLRAQGRDDLAEQREARSRAR